MGLQYQGTRQSHALLLPTAELVWTTRLQTGQLHQVEHDLDLARDLRLRQTSALHPQAEGDVVLYGEMREQGVMLKHDIDAADIGRLVVHNRAADADLTAVRGFQPPNQAQRGSLAAAAGPEQSKKFALVNGQSEIVYRQGSGETFGDMDEFHTGRSRHTLRRRLPYPRRWVTSVPRMATSKGMMTINVPRAFTIGETPRRIIE